jgi:predicted transcriptional regulator
MEVLWGLTAPAAVADVHAALPHESSIAYNTVKTTMERLAEKRILSRRKQGKAYLYTPAVTREELERRIVSTTLDRLVERFPQAVASFFVQPGQQLDEAKLALLQDAIERRTERQDA